MNEVRSDRSSVYSSVHLSISARFRNQHRQCIVRANHQVLFNGTLLVNLEERLRLSIVYFKPI